MGCDQYRHVETFTKSIAMEKSFGQFEIRRGDYCEVNACHNGATCVTGVGEDPFICICADGFGGDTCNLTETGPCSPNTCRNDGSCEVIAPTRRGDVFNEYICKCQPGFEGAHCQINVNDCAKDPCRNGGTCRDLDGDYTCQCPSPYVGKQCQLLYSNTAGCSEPLGMKSRLISDDQLSASSTYRTWGIDTFTWHPQFARLDKAGKTNAWSPAQNNRSEWIQVDLGKTKQLTGIITQGAKDFGVVQFVSEFKVAYSNDGESWSVVKDGKTGSDQIFQGNTDNNTHKKNVFEPPFYAQYVRVVPWEWHERVTLRMELLGCDD
ncbi:hypothetical protein CCH79_00004891 [Gambusia affinis]|uniref:EGF-like repeat and discoidin I-like domain-containing protein 3 n=1 Tax=Gambusia affinis TaxID=33528 RepID=A0A315V6J3_GAMAF|nr:hypothetical protein CCH79_00004891 [Gambusia affinis]